MGEPGLCAGYFFSVVWSGEPGFCRAFFMRPSVDGVLPYCFGAGVR